MAHFESSHRETARAPRYSTNQPRDTVLASETVEIERKIFKVQRCRNSRGEFLRVIEERHGGSSMIVIPETGWDQLLDAMESVLPSSQEKSCGCSCHAILPGGTWMK